MTKKSMLVLAVVVIVGIAGIVVLMLPRGEEKAVVPEPEGVPEVRPVSKEAVTTPKDMEPEEGRKPDIDTVKPEAALTPPAKAPERGIAPMPSLPTAQVRKEKIGRLNPGRAVRAIVGLDGDPTDYRVRMGAMKDLTRNLSTNDVTALRLFLNFRFDEQEENAKLRLLEFEGLKNDALTVLLAQDKLPASLGHQLAQMYRDNEHSDAWRAYCIQYIPEYYEQVWPADKEPEPEKGQEADPERIDMEKTCWEALEDDDSMIKGTALLALESLSGKYHRIDREGVEEAAVAMAVDDACEEPARITSLRICGMTGRKEALPTARMIAQTGETVPLRMAAIATLGDLGSEEDMELLESLSASKEKRIKRIAEVTLARLKKK